MKYKISQKNIVMLSIVTVLLLGVVGYLVYSASFGKENLPIHQAAPEFSMKDINGNMISFEISWVQGEYTWGNKR